MSFVEAVKASEILPGTMKHVETGGKELCIVNISGKFYAFGDRCPHMNASLSMGTLQGSIITCPLHFSRFDVITGKNLSGPVEPRMEGMDSLPPALNAYATRVAELQAPIRVHELEKFPVRVDGPGVFVDI